MKYLQAPIKITFEQSPKHLKDLMKTHAKKNKHYWIWIVMAIVIGLIGLMTILNAEEPLQMLLSYGIAMVLVGIIWYFLFRSIRKKQSQNKELYGQREMIFSSETIKTETALSSTTYSWDAIIKKVDSDLCYFLYVSGNQALVVPKDAFESEENRIAFEKLCAIKIGSIDRSIDNLIDNK